MQIWRHQLCQSGEECFLKRMSIRHCIPMQEALHRRHTKRLTYNLGKLLVSIPKFLKKQAYVNLDHSFKISRLYIQGLHLLYLKSGLKNVQKTDSNVFDKGKFNNQNNKDFFFYRYTLIYPQSSVDRSIKMYKSEILVFCVNSTVYKKWQSDEDFFQSNILASYINRLL